MPFSLLLASCTTEHIALPVIPPAERLICDPAGDRPAVRPEYVIDWTAVSTVDQAKAETQKLLASVHTREGVLVGYIVAIEGKLFACSTNAAWLRDFYAGLPKPPPNR